MNEHTLSDHVKVATTLAPQDLSGAAATKAGDGVDCQGFEGAVLAIEIGAITDAANNSITVKVQESSDNGVSDSYADVSGAATSAILNAGQNEVYLIELNLSERERYLRAYATAGSADGGLLSATFLLFRGRHGPPTQENTVTQVGFERS
jgi:hypothetical protein